MMLSIYGPEVKILVCDDEPSKFEEYNDLTCTIDRILAACTIIPLRVVSLNILRRYQHFVRPLHCHCRRRLPPCTQTNDFIAFFTCLSAGVLRRPPGSGRHFKGKVADNPRS